MEMQSQRYEAADVSVSLSGCGCYLDPSSGNNKRTLCSAVWHRKGLPGRGEEAGGEQKKKKKTGGGGNKKRKKKERGREMAKKK